MCRISYIWFAVSFFLYIREDMRDKNGALFGLLVYFEVWNLHFIHKDAPLKGLTSDKPGAVCLKQQTLLTQGVRFELTWGCPQTVFNDRLTWQAMSVMTASITLRLGFAKKRTTAYATALLVYGLQKRYFRLFAYEFELYGFSDRANQWCLQIPSFLVA